MAFTSLTRRSGAPYDPDDLTREINENFDKCAEVSLATVADGELLVYDGSSGVWINRTLSELAISIDDLSDVTVATPVDNDILLYDASSNTWLNVTGSAFAATLDLSDVGNVSVSTLADGEVLVWDASSNSWINATNTATVALDDVTDVSVSTPADGEVLTYDASSSTWINAASGGGGGGVTFSSDTLTLSGSSTDWSIPSGCVQVNLFLGDGNITTVSNPTISLIRASDGVKGSFNHISAHSPTLTTEANTSSSAFAIIGAAGNGRYGIEANIYFPRSSSKKSSGSWHLMTATDQKSRRGSSVATTAEDHDTIRFEGATTMTGTILITYVVQ